MSDHEFGLFQSLIRREAGIHLPPSKRPLLASRLMRHLGPQKLTSYAAYYQQVIYGGEAELTRMLDAICTNETWFFRNPAHFEFLQKQARSWLADAGNGRRSRRARVWSAGCSTGEEPFSLAMVLLDALPDWDLEVLATDLSSRALERARAAIWPLERGQDIPPLQLKRYMLRGTGPQHGKMKAGPEISRIVSFSRLNLNAPAWSTETGAPFDAIFCRNVLMYLEPSCRQRVVRRLLGCLTPRGHLFVGDAEGLNGFDGVRQVMPAVFTHRDRPEDAGRGGGP